MLQQLEYIITICVNGREPSTLSKRRHERNFERVSCPMLMKNEDAMLYASLWSAGREDLVILRIALVGCQASGQDTAKILARRHFTSRLTSKLSLYRFQY